MCNANVKLHTAALRVEPASSTGLHGSEKEKKKSGRRLK